MKKIVFMGTPDFAVSPLEKLNEKFDVKLVVTQKDKIRDRKKLLPTKVKEKAQELGLEVITPNSVKTDEFFSLIQKINPDFIIVVAFGKIINKRLIDFMQGRILNIHASILPELRGASPINFAIVNGLTKTGISIMSIDEGLDTGDVLATKETEISINENVEELYDRLKIMGSDLIIKVLENFDEFFKNRQKQIGNSTYAPIIKKEMGKIDFNDTTLNIHNKIRGFYNWPGAFCQYNGEILKIHQSKLSKETSDGQIGEIFKIDEEGFFVKTLDSSIKIIQIQFPGKKRVLVKDYLRGNSIKIGEILR